jgi:glutamate/tyrosine decarboxylase-like PLP-dependent enzyme
MSSLLSLAHEHAVRHLAACATRPVGATASRNELLAGLSGPTIICAQAGNVNTGSFDPLADVARLARRHGAWLHVDGAFGLWARASRRHRELAAGAELADSWATDAHKWLNVPYDCGVAIVRRPDDLRAAMTSRAAYLIQTAGSERDAVDWTPEISRRARGIPSMRRCAPSAVTASPTSSTGAATSPAPWPARWLPSRACVY